MINLWFAEAGANGAFPLDDRSAIEILTTERPQLASPCSRYIYYADVADIPEAQAVTSATAPTPSQPRSTSPRPAAHGVLFAAIARFCLVTACDRGGGLHRRRGTRVTISWSSAVAIVVWGYTAAVARLLIGPVLRHVGYADATVWVETDAPCEVEVHGTREHTWTVAGHHYALVVLTGLESGSTMRYEVHLDGQRAWPKPDGDRPASVIRTLGDDRSLRITFGSCRYGRTAVKLADPHFELDALACFARRMAGQGRQSWPDALLLLGDQVYADETSDATRRRIRAKRDIRRGAKDQVADFEEYTWLYLESWTDPDVRWLMSTVPTSMIFDDHDVRDDWNTSHQWREDMRRTSWWQDRIAGGLSSYWVYQHIGNLSPDELAKNDLFQQVRSHDGDAEPLLREFAAAADREADGAKRARWSFRRDFGRTRLLVADSRCGRILADGTRSMVSEDEFAWIAEQVDGNYDHLLLGTSLPWLLPRALHDLEAWNEVMATGKHGQRRARWAERLRRAADLEHWPAFGRSFEALAGLLGAVARGQHSPGAPPASVCVLSGDVHHAYAAQAQYPDKTSTQVYQLTCSPLHNSVPAAMKLAFRSAWSTVAERCVSTILRLTGPVPRPSLSWKRLYGPSFGNQIATLLIDGRRAEFLLERSARSDKPAELTETARLQLAS
jgi:PhoD-like phosphatase